MVYIWPEARIGKMETTNQPLLTYTHIFCSATHEGPLWPDWNTSTGCNKALKVFSVVMPEDLVKTRLGVPRTNKKSVEAVACIMEDFDV